MKNFRDYESLIRETINKINDKDENWIWTIHSFGKNCVTLRWGYLDGEKKYFSIKIEDPIDTSDGEMFITSRTPLDKMINGHITHEDHTKAWQESYENAIKSSLYECFYYASTRY